MLSIGRALIVLDDAAEGLAPLIVADIWRGIATLIVDRVYRKVLAHSDQALVLQKGQTVLQGRADVVSADPALSAYLGV